MHSFLNNIAEAYVKDADVTTYTFVFPNVRSRRYFAQCLTTRGISDHDAGNMCLTLTQFTELASGMHRASSERLIFLLYKAYCQVCDAAHAEKQEFERFRFWGQRILADFNDVDSYMANPDEIFRNTNDYKEIQSLYLTEAQASVIRKYWGDDSYWKSLTPDGHDPELPLWAHVGEKAEVNRKFKRFWAILGPIYHRFHALLQSGGWCYPGMAAKVVAEKLLRHERLVFNPRKYIFVGFNRLTTAETIIFEQLQEQGLAHFYWDYDPALMSHRGNPAGRFISKYVEVFAECNPQVVPPERPAQHRVDVVGIPSQVGQAKVMAQLLEHEDSAIVLPDSEMLLPVVASIPERFKEINVTMGYPLRFSALSQLFAQLVSLQLRSMTGADGDVLLFRDDVRSIITNPLVQAAFNEQCAWVDAYMRRESLFNLPASRLADPGFGPLAALLRPLGDNPTVDDMQQYLTEVLALAADKKLVTGIDAKCCEVIAKMMEQIVTLAEECNVALGKNTFFNIIERTLFQRSMPLEGESFEALQVMGVLETRAMGFASVIMLSMNDDKFPGRDASPSFIPESLRHAYGLPTRDHADVDAAYYFYHILSAARHLTMIYDGRIGGLTSGEMSRFIHQLQHLAFPGVNVNMKLAKYEEQIVATPSALISPTTTLPKTQRVMQKLNCYTDPGQLASSYLSASAIKEYIHCPMGFYFNRIERICPYDLDSESLNPAEYGSVVHEVADRIYKHLMTLDDGNISAEMLRKVLDGGYDDMLNRELTRAINVYRNHFPDTIEGAENPAIFTTEIVGEADVYRAVFSEALSHLFLRDIDITPFKVLGTEVDEKFAWQITPELSVNFVMKIDRLDQIVDAHGNKIIRVADYKTGRDETSAKSLDDLFKFGDPDFPQAIFQLFTYCTAYLDLHPEIDPAFFRPQIFTLRDPEVKEYPLITIGKTPIENFGQVYADFRLKLVEMFENLFDDSVPFFRSQNRNSCRFCKVFNFCNEDIKYREYKRK